MTMRRVAVVAFAIMCLSGFSLAQDEELPLANWSAPPFWRPTARPGPEGAPDGRMAARAQGMQARAEALPTSPLPFVAITPCRIVDTRDPAADGFHQPNFFDDQARTFNLPVSPNCPGLPATAGAYSINIQFRPISQLSYLTAYPTGIALPTVSTMTASPAAWVQNAAVVPTGLAGAIDIYCQYAGRVVIDVNGYYGPQSVVTSLNEKIGDVTLEAGSSVAITPSGNTLTIDMLGVPAGTLPAGLSGQTLYSNGSAWLPTSTVTINGTVASVNDNLALPSTTGASSGVLTLGGQPFLHAAGATSYPNTFVGSQAGSFGTSGQGGNVGVGSQALALNSTGAYNTAVGAFSLAATTTSNGNSAFGYGTLYSATGSSNSAFGYLSLYHNTASNNSAFGSEALHANSTATNNSAFGYQALQDTTTGTLNAAHGAYALTANDIGSWNTAVGAHSLEAANGDCNTGIGENALRAATTGDFNVGLGQSAGYYLTTGSRNTFLGANSGVDAAHPGVVNAVAIGAYSTVTQSNSMALGAPYGSGYVLDVGIGTSAPNDTLQVVGDVRVGTSGTNGCLKNYGGGSIVGTCSSDLRLKTGIRSFDPVLDRVARLQPVHFSWRAVEFPEYHFGAGVNSGLIAQDVEALFPEMVATDEHGYKTVNYSELPYLTLAAVRELKAKADALAAENSDLRDELRRLAAAVADLQAARR